VNKEAGGARAALPASLYVSPGKDSIVSELKTELIPRHVGVIMDGNGRWAKKRGLPRKEGHIRGAEVFGDIVRHAQKLGIEWLTVYAFSTENWNRPPDEVRSIMNLLRDYLKNADSYRKENIRTLIIGDKEGLDEDLRERIKKVEEGSAENTGIHVNIALNYGGRTEIVGAAQKIAGLVRSGGLDPEEIDEARFSSFLYTAGQPPVDLIIRTGGEMRVSNFLLWQAAYAEFYFTDILWPDFNGNDFDGALAAYSSRERRMGGV
jgi:undecaprenyl diphosphate synthase